MAWKTQYDREYITSEPGTPIKVNRFGRLNKNGVVEVIERGKDNLYDYIQSFADSVDLNVLISRFANGDETALNQVAGAYIDVTDLPKSYAEAFEMVQNASEMFTQLPAEIKEKYDNNLGKFVSDIGSDNFNSLFFKPVEPVVDVPMVEDSATAKVDVVKPVVSE